MSRFLIWCAGANPEMLDEAEHNRYVNTGLLILLISAAGSGSMFVLSGYALENLPLGGRIILSLTWSLIVFSLDRLVATTINPGGRWQGVFIYLPRILIALTIAILISEPVTSKVFEKEIFVQMRADAEAMRPTFEAEVDKDLAGQREKAEAAVTAAKANISALRAKATELKAEAKREEEGSRSTREPGCGPVCRGLLADAEAKENEARTQELALPALQEQADAVTANLAIDKANRVERRIAEYVAADGLIARHRALSRYLSTEHTALVVRWTLSLFLLLFELSIVLIKLVPTAYDRTMRSRLRRRMLLTDHKWTDFEQKVGDFAADENRLDMDAEKVVYGERRKRIQAVELRRLKAYRTAGPDRTGEPTAAAEPDADLSPTPQPSTDTRRPGAGDLVAGRFRLDREIGRGGHGVVYRGNDVQTGATVAVKMCESALYGPSWWREVRHTPGGKYMTRIIKAGRANQAYSYVVYPLYVPGSLRAFCSSGEGTTRDLAWCLTILEHVLFAVATAHRAGIVHGDIKPDNILLDGSRRNEMKAHVADWGISYQSGPAGSHTMISHWKWASPEQLTGPASKAVGELVDLFAIGSLAYWLISGLPPMERQILDRDLPRSTVGRANAYRQNLPVHSLSALNPAIPEEVSQLVDDWIHPDPMHRAAGGPPNKVAERALEQVKALKPEHVRYRGITLIHQIEMARRVGQNGGIPRQGPITDDVPTPTQG